MPFFHMNYHLNYFILSCISWTSVCLFDAQFDDPFKVTVIFLLCFFNFEIFFSVKCIHLSGISSAEEMEVEHKRTNSCMSHRKSNVF